MSAAAVAAGSIGGGGGCDEPKAADFAASFTSSCYGSILIVYDFAS